MARLQERRQSITTVDLPRPAVQTIVRSAPSEGDPTSTLQSIPWFTCFQVGTEETFVLLSMGSVVGILYLTHSGLTARKLAAALIASFVCPAQVIASFNTPQLQEPLCIWVCPSLCEALALGAHTEFTL